MIQLEIALPEVRESALVVFRFAQLERLEEELGPRFHAAVLEGLDALRPPIIRKLLDVGLVGASTDEALAALPLRELATRLFDAYARMIWGKTGAEVLGAPK